MEEVYIVFKIVALLGVGAALDRAWLASRKMWINRIGREISEIDTTKFETSPLEGVTITATGEEVVALRLMPDSDTTGVDYDEKLNYSQLNIKTNGSNSDLGDSPSSSDFSSSLGG